MSKIKQQIELEIIDEVTFMHPFLKSVLDSVTTQDLAKLELRVSSQDKHHPSSEEQLYYLTKKSLNPAYRPKCLDCGGIVNMIRCQHSYYCPSCKVERTHAMVLILKHYRR